jgi:putative membrane protein
MIKDFSDHAANERTYLAWVRTALAIAGFGVAAVKLNLVEHGLSAITGMVLVPVATGILVAATYRFIRLSRHLNRPDTVRDMGVGSDFVLSTLLMMFVVIFGFLLWVEWGA